MIFYIGTAVRIGEVLPGQDRAATYQKLNRYHYSVNHGVKENARGADAHVNGMESNSALLKRVNLGTRHSMCLEYQHL